MLKHVIIFIKMFNTNLRNQVKNKSKIPRLSIIHIRLQSVNNPKKRVWKQQKNLWYHKNVLTWLVWIIDHYYKLNYLSSRPPPPAPQNPHSNFHGIMWLSSVPAAAHNLDTITATLVAQPLSTIIKRCQSSNNVQSVRHPKTTSANRQFVWPLPDPISRTIKTSRGIVLCNSFIVLVLCCWSLATYNNNNHNHHTTSINNNNNNTDIHTYNNNNDISSCLWWLGVLERPRLSIHHHNLHYVHHNLLHVTMVDPLKIFWVLTNSTYLGELRRIAYIESSDAGRLGMEWWWKSVYAIIGCGSASVELSDGIDGSFVIVVGVVREVGD